MKRILLITNEEKMFNNNMLMFLTDLKDVSVSCQVLYNNDNLFGKIMRNLNDITYYCTLKKKVIDQIKTSDIIIIFDSIAKKQLIKCIKKINKSIRIIIYCRNKFDKITTKGFDYNYFLREKCEIWTYNLEDSKKYNLKYNHQFYNFSQILKCRKKVSERKRMIFVGQSKGREKILEKLYEIAKKINYETYFYLFPRTDNEYDKNEKNTYLDYFEYLKLLNESDVVVDLVTDDNYGLTMRPLEALCFDKKLITDYDNIILYSFYDKNNIHVLSDKCDSSELLRFLQLKHNNINKNIKENYSYEKWLKNFVEDVN